MIQPDLFSYGASLERTSNDRSSPGISVPEIFGVVFNLDGAGTNTKFSYMYRDANNGELLNDVVLVGRLLQADIQKIFDPAYDSKFFIASDVGLLNLQTRLNEGWTAADHPWHEICEIAYVDELPTAGKNQNPMAVSEFVAKWPTTAEEWDSVGTERRLIEAIGLFDESKYLDEPEQ